MLGSATAGALRDPLQAHPPFDADTHLSNQGLLRKHQAFRQTRKAPGNQLLEMRSPLILYLVYFALYERAVSD
jgi:hypothetical protein